MNTQVSQSVCARIPTVEGEFHLCVYANGKEHLAVIKGEVAAKENVLVRVHSECFTGDVLGSLRCDCGEQLRRAMNLIACEDEGVIIYLRQEGRGIGLIEKLRAYNLQDQGLDTVEANLALGHQADEREYSMAAHILNDLGVRSIRLLTNNPAKIEHLQALGVKVNERVPLEPTVHSDNADYLFTKALRMNHLFNFELPEPVQVES
jgi:GTP cyclohydrolase II